MDSASANEILTSGSPLSMSVPRQFPARLHLSTTHSCMLPRGAPGPSSAPPRQVGTSCPRWTRAVSPCRRILSRTRFTCKVLSRLLLPPPSRPASPPASCISPASLSILFYSRSHAYVPLLGSHRDRSRLGPAVACASCLGRRSRLDYVLWRPRAAACAMMELVYTLSCYMRAQRAPVRSVFHSAVDSRAMRRGEGCARDGARARRNRTIVSHLHWRSDCSRIQAVAIGETGRMGTSERIMYCHSSD